MNHSIEEDQKKTVKSELVSFTIERLPFCVVKYRVHCHPSIVEKAKKGALEMVAKELSIPGFRKGKAPAHLVEKSAPASLMKHWEKTIAGLSFEECQKVAHIPLLNSDSVVHFRMDDFSIEKGCEMTFSFETKPTPPKIDYSAIELKEVEKELIDDARVDQRLHQIQSFFAKWEPVSRECVTEGDFVLLDIDIIETLPHQKALENARFEVSREKMAKWMYDTLIGMKVGESKEGVSIPDHEEEQNHLPPKRVSVQLKAIESPLYPPIDDALAKQVGAKSVQEMRSSILELLKANAISAVQDEYRQQVSEYLIRNYSLDLPLSLLEEEISVRIKQEMESRKSSEQMTEEERKGLVEMIRTRARDALSLFYFSEAIAKEQNIVISPKEVELEVSNPLDALVSGKKSAYRSDTASKEERALAFSRILLRRVQDFIISQAKIVPAQGQITQKEEKKGEK